MQKPVESGAPNPHDLTLHKQVKEIASCLKPELARLHTCLEEASGKDDLYKHLLEEVKAVKKEVTNHDMLFAFHNIIDHLSKAMHLAEKKEKNKEILLHLQEAMALLFKTQNLPS
ncbi:MAG: hypothetical protein FJZ58_03620 [Chlamydiae bacterium]|nr:hypothetical protein [Chlamydiota bacterium]